MSFYLHLASSNFIQTSIVDNLTNKSQLIFLIQKLFILTLKNQFSKVSINKKILLLSHVYILSYSNGSRYTSAFVKKENLLSNLLSCIKEKKKKLKEAKLLQAIDGKDEQELFISAEKTRFGSGREKGWSGSR